MLEKRLEEVSAMKIRCEYCDSMFDDTLEKCPNCYAPNPNVRRSTPDQPTTIEGLKEWYESKGLPPYETTRFFIGIDYKKPRAFGIYKDENTGNFIVYKNKDNGQRAVRYEGTDEAYAVNELFMRLKQEIIEQKSHSTSNSSNQSGQYNAHDAQKYYDSYNSRRNTRSIDKGPRLFKRVFTILIIIFGLQVIGHLLSLGFFSSAFRDEFKNMNLPQRGYYSYGGNTYYSFGSSAIASERWSIYNKDTDSWELTNVDSISVFEKDKDASPYYLSETYSSDYDFPSFSDTRLYYDIQYGDGYVSSGYYSYDDKDYYHLDSSDSSSWYVYSDDKDDWVSLSSSEVPESLSNQYDAKDFYYVPNWNSETQITDFKDSEYYAIYERDKEAERQSSYSSSDSWDSDDSYDYSWDSGSDSWDSGSTDWDSDW